MNKLASFARIGGLTAFDRLLCPVPRETTEILYSMKLSTGSVGLGGFGGDYTNQDFILMKKGSLVMSLKMTIAAKSRMQTNATW